MIPAVESNVRPGPGSWFPMIDQVKGGVPDTTSNFSSNAVLTTPFMGDTVVMPKGGGGGGGAGADPVDTLLESLQALRLKVAARKSRMPHNMFLVIVRPFTNALPLFWR